MEIANYQKSYEVKKNVEEKIESKRKILLVEKIFVNVAQLHFRFIYDIKC